MNTLATGMPTPILQVPVHHYGVIIAVTTLILIIALSETARRLKNSNKKTDSNDTGVIDLLADINIFILAASLVLTFMHVPLPSSFDDSQAHISIGAIERHYNVKMLQADINAKCDNTMPDVNENSNTNVTFLDAKGVKNSGLLKVKDNKTTLYLKQPKSNKIAKEYIETKPVIKQPHDSVDIRGEIPTTSTKWFMGTFILWTLGCCITLIRRKNPEQADRIAMMTVIMTMLAAFVGGMIWTGELFDDNSPFGKTHEMVPTSVKTLQQHYGIKSVQDIDSDESDCDYECVPKQDKKTLENLDSIYLYYIGSQPTSITTISFTKNGITHYGAIRTVDFKSTLYVPKNGNLIEYRN